MTTICCVHNCPTHSTHSNLKLTYFILPKENEIKDEWLKALNNLVRPNSQILSVCELHFQQEDVLRFHYTVIDGKLIKLDKFTTALRKTAIPCIFNEPYPNLEFLLQKENSMIMQTSHNLKLSTSNVLVENVNDCNDISFCNDNINKLTSIVHNSNIELQNADSKCSSLNPVETGKASTVDSSQSVLQSIENVLQQQEIHLMAGDKVQIINIKDFPQNLTEPVALRIKPLNNKSVESTLEPVAIKQSKESIKPFTISDLKRCLDNGQNMKIQNYWRYIAEKKSVLFFYMDFPGRGISKTVYIGEDMKVEVRVADHIIPMQEVNVMKNIDHISKFLYMVGSMKICEELFNSESCDLTTKRCAKLFYVKKYTKTKNNKYCNECCEIKKIRSENEKKIMIRNMKIMVRKQNQQRKMEDLKNYCTILKRKVAQMNKHMRNLTEIYTTSKIKELENELSFLPNRQREVVKTFISSIKHQPGKRKFSDQWINESSLIYSESPKVYKYLRTNEILPLPSIDTLRTYKKTASPSLKKKDNPFHNLNMTPSSSSSQS